MVNFLNISLSQKNYNDLKNVIEKSDCIHCVSDDLARHLKQFGLTNSKVFINRPAIDSNYFMKQNLRVEDKNQIIKILSTGRLHFSKGYVYALLAVKELLNKGYNIEYNIIGDGSEYEQICFQIVDCS